MKLTICRIVKQVSAVVSKVGTRIIVGEHKNTRAISDDLLEIRTDRLALLVNMFVEMEIGRLLSVERETAKRVLTNTL
jgi:hypothetical protein